MANEWEGYRSIEKLEPEAITNIMNVISRKGKTLKEHPWLRYLSH